MSLSEIDLEKTKEKTRYKFARMSLNSDSKAKKENTKYNMLNNTFQLVFRTSLKKRLIRKRTRKSVDVSILNSLNDVLKSSSATMMFREFLRSEHSQENLEFWFSVQEFKRELTIEKAKEIYQIYIKTGSELEININHEVRERIEIKLNKRFEPEIFSEAENSVLSLMENDSFKRFKKKLENGTT